MQNRQSRTVGTKPGAIQLALDVRKLPSTLNPHWTVAFTQVSLP